MTARVLLAAACAATLVACDAGFDGSPDGNVAPDTELSVRSTDLTEDLGERRLVSTVELAWSGTDPDGIVAAYDVRAYQRGETPAPEAGWARTTRRDSTILLPIPLGQDTANVTVEVRAVDNDGAVDETPAQTVFPIRNSDPAFSLSRTEVPAETSWPVLSFAFAASDPDGDLNLAAVEVVLNDTLGAVQRLPADATFVTLVADDPGALVTDARVFVGRGFTSTDLVLPGLQLDADNRVYFRAVDQAGATSPWTAYPDPADDPPAIFVRRVTSSVLLVNDYRATPQGTPSPLEAPTVQLSRDALALYGTAAYDEWDLSETAQVTASPTFSEGLPLTADPTLRQTLALWDRIVWVSNRATNSASGNNLPFAATVLDLFFERGGRMLVHVPITLPQGTDGGTANAAIDILPLRELVAYPEGARAFVAQEDTPVRPVATVPGAGRALPQLRASRFLYNVVLPYVVGPDDVSLYEMSFDLDTGVPWTGAETLASIRTDRRVALFSLPVNDSFEPDNPEGEGLETALAVLLDALDFPQ